MDNINHIKLQSQYDKIYSYLRTTRELFDFLKWDGMVLLIWDNEVMIEKYSLKDLERLIFNLSAI